MDLVIMAAGMGSRFGGLKQIEPIDSHGNFIIDYSIFDAIRAGFDRVVFIINKQHYNTFKETIGSRIEDKIKVEYVFQEIENLPYGFATHNSRVKPWGTAHAIWCCKDIVKDDFLTINADDFYGKESFMQAAQYIKQNKDENYGLVAFKVANTLSENGTAKRGVCFMDGTKLKGLSESAVEKVGRNIVAKPLAGGSPYVVKPNALVSMNMWCLKPTIFEILDYEFERFLEENLTNSKDCEFLLPDVLNDMLRAEFIEIDVCQTKSKWLGVTYKEDKQSVQNGIKALVDAGEYPLNLWGDFAVDLNK